MTTPFRHLALFTAAGLLLLGSGCIVVDEHTSEVSHPKPQPIAAAPAAAAPVAAMSDVLSPTTKNITPSQTQPFRANAKVTSTVIDTTKVAMQSAAYGSRAQLFTGPSSTLETFEAHLTTVNPGQSSHGPHMHPHEEMLIVKEGTLQVTIADKTYIAGPGSIIYYSTNDPHGTKNIGTVPASYYVFSWITDQTPRPLVTTPVTLPESPPVAN